MWGRPNASAQPFLNQRRQIAERKPTGQLYHELFTHEATREGLHHFLACPYCFNNWLTSCTEVPLPWRFAGDGFR
jgi:hypothetical protein